MWETHLQLVLQTLSAVLATRSAIAAIGRSSHKRSHFPSNWRKVPVKLWKGEREASMRLRTRVRAALKSGRVKLLSIIIIMNNIPSREAVEWNLDFYSIANNIHYEGKDDGGLYQHHGVLWRWMLSWGPSQYQFDPGEEQGSLKGAVPFSTWSWWPRSFSAKLSKCL